MSISHGTEWRTDGPSRIYTSGALGYFTAEQVMNCLAVIWTVTYETVPTDVLLRIAEYLVGLATDILAWGVVSLVTGFTYNTSNKELIDLRKIICLRKFECLTFQN